MLALVLLPIVAAAVQATQPGVPPLHSSPPIFTNNELNEHNHVWKLMNKACFGKWSGALQCFQMDKTTSKPILDDDGDELLNFRLWAKADTNRMGRKKDTGTWTAWNLQRKGDKITVPLRRLPTTSNKPTQIKLGFAPGCVLRVPSHYKQVARAVIELGYWGNGMRRTVVLEYQPRDKQKHMELKDVTLVTQRAVPWYKNIFFVGNTTVARDIQIGSPKAANVEDVIKRNKSRIPIRVERVELQSMHRVVTTAAEIKQEDKTGGREVLESLLLQLSNNDCGAHSSYDVLLPNGLLASFPREMMDKNNKSKTKRFIFAHEWKHGQQLFQAMVIDFDTTSGEAITATMYSYK